MLSAISHCSSTVWLWLGFCSWVLWVGCHKIYSNPQKARSCDKAAEDDLDLAGFTSKRKKKNPHTKKRNCSHDPFQKDKFRAIAFGGGKCQAAVSSDIFK